MSSQAPFVNEYVKTPPQPAQVITKSPSTFTSFTSSLSSTSSSPSADENNNNISGKRKIEEVDEPAEPANKRTNTSTTLSAHIPYPDVPQALHMKIDNLSDTVKNQEKQLEEKTARVKHDSDRLTEHQTFSEMLVKEKESLRKKPGEKGQQLSHAARKHEEELVELDQQKSQELAQKIKEIEEKHAREIAIKNEELINKLQEKDVQHKLELQNAAHTENSLNQQIAFLRNELARCEEALLHSESLRSETKAEVKREIEDRDTYLDLNTTALKRRVRSLQSVVDMQGEVVEELRGSQETVEISEDRRGLEPMLEYEDVALAGSDRNGKTRAWGSAAFDVSFSSHGGLSGVGTHFSAGEYEVHSYYPDTHHLVYSAHPTVDNQRAFRVSRSAYGGGEHIPVAPREDLYGYTTHDYYAHTMHHHSYYQPRVNSQQGFIIPNEDYQPMARSEESQSPTNEIHQPNIRFGPARKENRVSISPGSDEGYAIYEDHDSAYQEHQEERRHRALRDERALRDISSNMGFHADGDESEKEYDIEDGNEDEYEDEIDWESEIDDEQQCDSDESDSTSIEGRERCATTGSEVEDE
ncbi:hypothetical protein ACMFMG_001898 [Clarireedia jacksonii]